MLLEMSSTVVNGNNSLPKKNWRLCQSCCHSLLACSKLLYLIVYIVLLTEANYKKHIIRSLSLTMWGNSGSLLDLFSIVFVQTLVDLKNVWIVLEAWPGLYDRWQPTQLRVNTGRNDAFVFMWNGRLIRCWERLLNVYRQTCRNNNCASWRKDKRWKFSKFDS